MTTNKVDRPQKAAVKSAASIKKTPTKPKQQKSAKAAKQHGNNGNSHHKEVIMGNNRKTTSSFTRVTTKFFVATGLSLAAGLFAPWQGEADNVGLAVAHLPK
ncbi:MAG: hypothetical protein H7Y60_14165 [Rhodospirillaceae bacterium]|nr:hypothetical protein [Rhodospirillales bacterium]